MHFRQAHQPVTRVTVNKVINQLASCCPPHRLDIPVKFIGVGEQIDDMQPFDRNMFVDALFD